MSSTRIPIHVSNQTAFVWDVDHVATLRSEHRICGVLSGTLPHLSQQNIFLGLPLVLAPEELVLLLEKQLATIIHDPASHHLATPAQLESWDAQRQLGIAQQIRDAERRKGEDRAAIGSAASEAAAQKKRAEREARRQRQLAEATKDDGAGPAAVVEGAAPSSPSPSSQPPANAAVYTVAVPTTSDAFAWYAPDAHTYDTLDAAREAGVWTYPATEEERARCEVFRDLWEKGYYLGGGGKFGGDWLVYPGDPLRYHSHFVATVQTSPPAPLRPMEIVAHGRLGTATKKAHLLCGWDAASREVTYISIEWAGFG